MGLRKDSVVGFGGFFDYDGSGAPDDELDFLREFGDAQWDALLAHTQTERVLAGQTMLAVGAGERALYLVAEGRLEVLVGTGSRQQRLAYVGPGSVVGEQTFIDGRPRSAEVRAVSDARVLRLTLDGFESFGAQYPDLARAVLFDLARILSLRLRKTTALVIAGR